MNDFTPRISRNSLIRGTAAAALALFAFTAIYTPIHLIIEDHTGDGVILRISKIKKSKKEARSTHVPHPASDHVREVLPEQNASPDISGAVLLPAPVTVFIFCSDMGAQPPQYEPVYAIPEFQRDVRPPVRGPPLT